MNHRAPQSGGNQDVAVAECNLKNYRGGSLVASGHNLFHIVASGHNLFHIAADARVTNLASVVGLYNINLEAR